MWTVFLVNFVVEKQKKGDDKEEKEKQYNKFDFLQDLRQKPSVER